MDVLCKKCNGMFLKTFFSPDRRRKNGLNPYCKSCMREYGRKNYHENKSRYFAVAKERDKRLDDLIVSFKNKPCLDCGKSYPPYVMDFDHIGDKEYNISYMRRHRMAFDKIIEEIKKCEVVCANCHRERTNTRNPSTRYAALAQELTND